MWFKKRKLNIELIKSLQEYIDEFYEGIDEEIHEPIYKEAVVQYSIPDVNFDNVSAAPCEQEFESETKTDPKEDAQRIKFSIPSSRRRVASDLEEALKKMDESFSMMLLRKIDEKGGLYPFAQ